MEHLTVEIARQIAAELDIESARCLARASRGVREIGEMRLWRSVVIQPVVFMHPGQENQFPSPLRALSDNLESHPPRVDYVTELTISRPPQTPASSELLLTVLRKVAGTIQHLRLTLPPLMFGAVRHSERLIGDYHAMLKRLAGTGRRWDKVIELRVPVAGADGLELAAAIMTACPRLQALMLQPVASPARSISLAAVPQTNNATSPQLPNLTALAIVPLPPAEPVDEFDMGLQAGYDAGDIPQRYREIVDRVLPCAKGIEILVMEGPHPFDAPTLRTTVESLPNLNKLFLDLSDDFTWGPTAEVDTPLSVLWLRREMLYGRRYAKSILSAVTPRPKYPLPTFPHLRTLTFCGSIDTGGEPLVWTGPERMPLGFSTHMANLCLVDNIDQQPSLRGVLLRPTSLYERVHGSFKDGYLERGYCHVYDNLHEQHGTIARKYTCPYDSGTIFWHVRSMQSLSRGQYKDFGAFRGRYLTAANVRKVCRVSGHPVDFATTKLDCRFGEKEPDGAVDLDKEAATWKMLEGWHARPAYSDLKTR